MIEIHTKAFFLCVASNVNQNMNIRTLNKNSKKSKPSFLESLLQLVLKMFENDFKDGTYYRDRFRSPNEGHQND